MKLEIYNAKQEEKEQVVRLALRYDCRDIDVVAVDENGVCIRLLASFCDNGTLHRYSNAGYLGFQADEDGKIRIRSNG